MSTAQNNDTDARSSSDEAQSCAQAETAQRTCPECGSQNLRNTGMGSGEMTSTYARFTTRYECRECGNWFSETREYDKTEATTSSLRALQQVESGEMNEYACVDQLMVAE